MVYRFATEFICPNKHTILIKKKLNKINKKIVRQYQKREKSMTRLKLVKRLDKLVSDKVKELAKGKCELCGKVRMNMGASHYFNRDYMGTRWDFSNLAWFCWMPCHFRLEKRKNTEYRYFMLKRLGPVKLRNLEVKALAITKFSRFDLVLMIDNFKKL